jgi:hypothetical protein
MTKELVVEKAYGFESQAAAASEQAGGPFEVRAERFGAREGLSRRTYNRPG